MDYETIQANHELRRISRHQMRDVLGILIFTHFVFFLINVPYTTFSILEMIRKEFSFLYTFGDASFAEGEFMFSIITLLTRGAFIFGFAGFFLKRVRGQEFGTMNIFDGFLNGIKNFFSYFVLDFLINLFVFLWLLLLIVPGVMKFYSYRMAFYIKYDEPEIGLLDAIDKSKAMMQGCRLKLALLDLSFIGWIVLSFLTLGLGFFVLFPYMGLSEANFYENLKRSQEKAPEAFSA